MLLPATTALAQIVPGWNTKQFSLERIDADRVRLMREVEIEGEPGSTNAGQKFFADDLEMNIKTGELTARGNVVFQSPTVRIAADSVVFNTKTRLGKFDTAFGIAQLGERGERNQSMFGTLEPDVYFYGTTIEKVGPDKYRITNGGFTTCVQPTPRWEIVSGNATVNLDDYVILRNAVIRVKDVPVFYLPMLYYPIQEDDRATGILLPQYGSSLAMGSSIGNAFFWAINRSHDATFFHDWMFSRGNGLGTEYRYMLGPQAQGNLRYYWLDEKEAIVNGAPQPARQSKTIQGGLSQNLPFGLSARARVDYFTNVTVQQTYSHDFTQATNSNRTIDGGVSGILAQPVGEHAVQADRNVLQRGPIDGQRPRARLYGGAERRQARPAADLRHRQRRGRARALHRELRRRRVRFGPGKGRLRAVDPRPAQHPAVPAGERHRRVPHDLLQ